jgi:hypothetical protein
MTYSIDAPINDNKGIEEKPVQVIATEAISVG